LQGEINGLRGENNGLRVENNGLRGQIKEMEVKMVSES
jgi:hypothetical protein